MDDLETTAEAIINSYDYGNDIDEDNTLTYGD